ncbi:MAG: N-formylglutamate amidohydrolase [Methyloligellaceae bacterium]
MDQSRSAQDSIEISPAFFVDGAESVLSPFVFNSPHSGRTYPDSFIQNSCLTASDLRKSEDSFVENLFDHVCELGAPLLHANFPRAFIDVNREPYELDPELFRENLPKFANTQSVRVAGGLGTIPRMVSEADRIYANTLELEDAFTRINTYYKPYHSTLGRLLELARNKFGYVILVDCHSMPSLATQKMRPDFVLGDRFGTSCNSALTQFVESKLRDMGYQVARNKPYAGGYITEHYGQPSNGIQALQIEINRALYMNESLFEKNGTFDQVRTDLAYLCQNMMAEIPDLLTSQKLAAE